MQFLTPRKPLVLFGLCSISFTLAAQVTPPTPYSANAPVNYIRTWETTRPVTNANDLTIATELSTAKMTTQYFDGLGRLLQVVNKQAANPTSGTVSDLVQAIVYDPFGRELYQYLPFAANSTGGNSSLTDGLFKLNPFQQQATFGATQYPGEQFFYSKNNFESSPLNRITSTYAPGNSWSGSEEAVNPNQPHGIQINYLINTSNDAVRLWEVDNNTGAISSSSPYNAGELYKTATTDEHGKQIIEYKDKQQQIILRKVQLDDTPGDDHTGWLCTYYVYDDIGDLRLVIPPKATQELATGSWNLSQNIKDGLCYRYEYDERRRPIVKKLPGAAEIRMVYDARDRLVLTQDGNRYTAQQWLYTQYDGLNRPIATGLITDPGHYNDHNWHRQQADGNIGYPNLASYTYQVYTETFYDNYEWRSNHGNPLSDARSTSYDSYFFTPDNNTWPYPQDMTQTNSLIGSITGTRTFIPGANTYLYSVLFYDSKSRLIQVRSENITGGSDVVATQYTWTGKPLMIAQRTVKGGANTQTTVVLTRFTYDELERLVKTEKRISNGLINSGAMTAWTTTYQLAYDALGKIQQKTIGNNLETIDYTYNIRGWLTGINRDFVNNNGNRYFGMQLGYDQTATVISGASFAAPQFNGNIGGMAWKSKGDGQQRKYDFNYDAARRMLQADFNQYTGGSFNKTAGIDFTVKMGNGSSPTLAYDYNGNIIRMQQWGLKGFSSSAIDDLNYTYESYSNRLKNVLDAQNEPLTTLGDFRSSQTYMTALGGSKTNAATDYTYDNNGNLTRDLNKDFDDPTNQPVEYNYLNQPTMVRVKNKGSIEFVYDALGNLLQKTIKETGQSDHVILYLNNLVLLDDVLQWIGHEEGRIRPIGTTSYAFDYFLKDHLENVRAVLTDEIVPETGYQATMESANYPTEDALFSQIGETVDNKPGGFDTDGGNQKVSKLFNASGNDKRIGPGVLLKVMAGDQFKAGVKGWYLPGSTNADALPGAASIVTSLVSAFSGGIGGIAGHTPAGGTIPGSTELTSPLQAFITANNNSTGTGVPKAYLNWIVLDQELFQLVEGNYGAIPIPEITGSMEKQAMVANGGNNIEVLKNGYLYVYVSNESQGNVYFDDLTITHTRGPLLEETHYYPFGLVMAGISSQALRNSYPVNTHKFNKGSELHHKEFSDGSGLEWYSTQYRTLDPQLGRWNQLDPKPDMAQSPYSAMAGNPLLYNDPLGDTIKIRHRTGFLGIFGKKENYTYVDGKLYGSNGAEVDRKDVKSFVRKAAGALDKVREGGEVGNDMVTTLQNEEAVTYVMKGQNSYTENDMKENLTNVIRWTPGNNSSGVNEKGKTGRPSFIGLGHEMAHKLENTLTGRNNHDIWYKSPGGERNVPIAEQFAMHVENLLRAENNLPLRANYATAIERDANTNAILGEALLPNTRIGANNIYPNYFSTPYHLPVYR